MSPGIPECMSNTLRTVITDPGNRGNNENSGT